MTHYEMQYLEDKIEEVLRNLRKSNSRYSAAAKNEGELYARIKNIIDSKGEIFISDAERDRIRELMEQEDDILPIVQAELYRQGYLDHMRLAMSLIK